MFSIDEIIIKPQITFYSLMVIFSTGYETRFTIFETVKNKHFFNANKKYLTSSIQPFNDTKLKLKSIRLVLKYHNNSNKVRLRFHNYLGFPMSNISAILAFKACQLMHIFCAILLKVLFRD